MIVYYCDGSTRGGKNQKGADNIGGWGVTCFYVDDEGHLLHSFDCESCYGTTNNREELKAFIYCLSHAQSNYSGETVTIRSDSSYVVNIWNSWISGWAAKGWKNSKGSTVENLDLVQEIYKYYENNYFDYNVEKIDGHCGELGNEMADALATQKFKRFISLCEENDIRLEELDYMWIERQMIKFKEI